MYTHQDDVRTYHLLFLFVVRSIQRREILLQPKLRSPESVAFHNSRFKDVNGLKVRGVHLSADSRICMRAGCTLVTTSIAFD